MASAASASPTAGACLKPWPEKPAPTTSGPCRSRTNSPEGTPSPKKVAGTYSGAGETLQGLIAATARKDSGLAQPLAAAINHLIENGQYATWLQAWGLSNEALPKSELNPPGLPITDT